MLKIGRKEAHDTADPWPHLEVERSEVKVIRLLNAMTEKQPYLNNNNNTNICKAHIVSIRAESGMDRPTNFKLHIQMEYDDRHARGPPSWKLWVPVQCSSYHLEGRGILWRPSHRPHSLKMINKC